MWCIWDYQIHLRVMYMFFLLILWVYQSTCFFIYLLDINFAPYVFPLCLVRHKISSSLCLSLSLSVSLSLCFSFPLFISFSLPCSLSLYFFLYISVSISLFFSLILSFYPLSLTSFCLSVSLPRFVSLSCLESGCLFFRCLECWSAVGEALSQGILSESSLLYSTSSRFSGEGERRRHRPQGTSVRTRWLHSYFASQDLRRKQNHWQRLVSGR